MKVLNRISAYLHAAAVLRSPNWLGLPLIPKSVYSGFPGNRSAYNSFIVLIQQFHLPAASLIVDVGAHWGDFSFAANACFPQAEVLVVEPLEKMQRCLEHTMRTRKKNWRLLPFALGAKPGKLPLFVDETRDDIASLVGFSEEYLKVNADAHPASNVFCDVKTLDTVTAELGVEQIDLLKIDVEGFEFEVIKGAEQILKRTVAIIIEVSLVRKTGTSNPLVEMLDLLARHDFQIVNVIPSLMDPEEPWKPREFNILARRETK